MVQSVMPLQPVSYVPVQPIGQVAAAAGQAAAVQVAAALAEADAALLEAGAPVAKPGAVAEPPSPVAQALKAAVAQAAGAQGGLAPLMADLSQAVAVAALSAPVKAAAQQVLALQTPLSPEISAPVLRQAVAQSGLFLEARLAARPEMPPGADLKTALLVLRQVLAAAAPAREGPGDGGPKPPTTPAPAPPPAAPAAQSAGQPNPARLVSESDVVRQPSAEARPMESRATASAVPAVSTQGATGSEPQPAQPASAKLSPPPLAGPAPAAVSPAPPAAQPATAPAASAPASDAQVPQHTDLEPPPTPYREGGRTASEPAAQQSAASPMPPQARAPGHPQVPPPPTRGPAPPARETPPPPFRGGPTHAQRPATPTLRSTADGPAVAEQLLQETRAALARGELLQAASLPDDRPTPFEGGTTPRPESRWMFDLPFATPQGPAVAQFEISRDGAGQGPRGAEPVWRARFSVNLEPTGAVHAALSLTARRAAVTLWAERPERAAQLRGRVDELSRRLREAAETVEVAVYAGAPPSPAPATGRLVDQAT